ncbi:VOC family protein [Reichenbachiella sp.]|uniref:VOC family protein n=1 Tax=Reichenbachiella sp. TaxID=2184521 RepID=UPI0032980551
MENANQNPFNKSELTTILVVSDVQKSKVFYQKVLGSELFREYGGDSVVLKFLGHWILLVSSGEPTADKPDIRFEPPAQPNKVGHAYTIRVEDCQHSYEILKARGAEFITPPYNWGAEIRCFFQDPDGHLFEISEYRG